MSDDRGYRLSIRFNKDVETFRADVAELSLTASAASRSEAVELIERAIEDRLQAAAEGDPLPEPIDVVPVSGTVTIRISEGLHRELLFAAKTSNMTPEALAAELIARGLGDRAGPLRQQRRHRSDDEENGQPEPRDSNRAGNRDDRGRRPGHGGPRREGYRPELEDKANFLEYLRTLEKGGPGGRGRH